MPVCTVTLSVTLTAVRPWMNTWVNGVPRFFDPPGLAALRRLGEILVPGRQNLPGATEAEAAEFLDFLIGQSPPDRQSLYREGTARFHFCLKPDCFAHFTYERTRPQVQEEVS